MTNTIASVARLLPGVHPSVHGQVDYLAADGGVRRGLRVVEDALSRERAIGADLQLLPISPEQHQPPPEVDGVVVVETVHAGEA